jgi:hypothetical protein
MSFLFLALRVREKYFTKNLSASYLQVEIELGSREFNQDLALPLREYGNCNNPFFSRIFLII